MRRNLNNNNVDSAILLNSLLEKESRTSNSKKYQLRSAFYKAQILIAQNNEKAALEEYFKVLSQSRSWRDPEMEGSVLDEIGQLYFEQKNYPEASRFFNESIKAKEKLGDEIRLGNGIMNVALLYRRMNMPDSAGKLLERVRIIASGQRDSLFLGNFYNALATHYFRVFTSANRFDESVDATWDRDFMLLNFRDSADVYWNRALQFWSGKKYEVYRINPLFNLGYLYQTKKQFQQAVSSYETSVRLMKIHGINRQEATIYGNLGEIHYDLKNYKEAADYFRKVVSKKDSLLKDETRAYALKLEKQYQLDNKNKTILEQELELAKKEAELQQQQKKIYLYLLVAIVALIAVALVILYNSFNKRVAQKVEKVKEKFFSNIMHEIRTPLSMIQAPLKTLRPKINDDEGLYYISLAEKNVVRLNELINQMLDLSKIDNLSYKLSPSVGNAHFVISEITLDFQKQALEKGINFVSEINCSSELYLFDKDALQKILGNLLSNAIKYTSAKGSTGIIVTCEEKEHSSEFKIEVWDTGQGIASEDHDKIFDRFYRSHANPSQTKGVGIGLALVKELVAAWNGTIHVESEIGKGSRFITELVFPQAVSQEILSPQSPGQALPLILLIEDDEDILLFVESFLTSRNLRVIKAMNGIQAKAILKNVTPDLIVTDLMMEQLDGLNFINQLKADKGLNHIPVIVLSAKSSSQTRLDVINAGAQVFVNKPFLPEELFAIISNQLSLISETRNAFKNKVEEVQKLQSAEEKFSSSEPYTQKLFDLIFKHLDNSELSVEMLADLMATNRSHFQRKIKTLTGYSPSELIKLIRLEKAKEFLLAKKGNVTEVAYMCGFSSQSYFTRCYTQHFGSNPAKVISSSGA